MPMLQPSLQPHHTDVLHLWRPNQDGYKNKSGLWGLFRLSRQRKNNVEYSMLM